MSHNHNYHHCEDEHHDGHNHTAPIPTNPGQSLYQFIDTTKIRCFNVVGNGCNEIYKGFLKDRDNRFNCSSYAQSDADCQVIVHIPFTATCRVFSIILRTNVDDSSNNLNSPKTIKIFNNFKKNLDFDTLNSAKPDLSIEQPQNVGVQAGSDDINEDESTFVEHYFPRINFQNCSSLTLFLQDNWSGDEDELSRLYYLEIRGEPTGKLQPDNSVPLMAVYEAAPNPAEHNKLEQEADELNFCS
ncbi:hypothetical protein Kpol_1041p38 [Vanderwaltozyma polyspora DSM 70294]|uniref:PITH domain-containing protein n=1 Tax=Vanderwaltozyma polyspora (strain ATCC 22028 / DSM 70294 / BCRC 21397 / CBS 2163 / NBRC 10782 / NRRL Y-8283 / UCD 57-17) TaxID=436907 RepID=A7TLA5_VANPO|nr:uncharacterized protein Kpol_1041p38 [Vanderwaltozyma polyspora DSM 70294]EDO16980.1 hypothetical protein Kpol_1041p38 [Vanderwaltozyma polyspora DSM 70294]